MTLLFTKATVLKHVEEELRTGVKLETLLTPDTSGPGLPALCGATFYARNCNGSCR